MHGPVEQVHNAKEGQNQMNKVLFITYSSHDEFQVQQIASELRKQIPVFAYPFDVPGGAQINEGIRERPENIILTIALSQSSIAEEWIKSKISSVILEPLKNSITVFLLKLEGIPANILNTLPYGHKHETIDLSGEYYKTGISTLMQRIGFPLPTVMHPGRRHVP
jgi:hypothetical protein